MNTHLSFIGRFELIAVFTLFFGIPSGFSQPPMTKNENIMSVREECEELVERPNNVESFEIKLKQLTEHLEKILNETELNSASKLKDFINRMKLAENQIYGEKLQLDCLNACELLTYSLESALSETPLEIDLLRFSGARLHVLSISTEPNWNSIREESTKCKENWRKLSDRVKRTYIRDASNTVLEGIEIAVESMDLPMLKFASMTLIHVMRITDATWNSDK